METDELSQQEKEKKERKRKKTTRNAVSKGFLQRIFVNLKKK